MLLEKQTRLYKDFDVMVLLDDVFRMSEPLGRAGYRLKEFWVMDASKNKIATAFVLQNTADRELDANSVRLDKQGSWIPAWEAHEVFLFNRQHLTGMGMIAGFLVRCITLKCRCFTTQVIRF